MLDTWLLYQFIKLFLIKLGILTPENLILIIFMYILINQDTSTFRASISIYPEIPTH